MRIKIGVVTLAALLALVTPASASVFYSVFLSRIDRLIMDIDDWSQQLVNLISAEELQQRNGRVAKNKRPVGREAA